MSKTLEEARALFANPPETDKVEIEVAKARGPASSLKKIAAHFYFDAKTEKLSQLGISMREASEAIRGSDKAMLKLAPGLIGMSGFAAGLYKAAWKREEAELLARSIERMKSNADGSS